MIKKVISTVFILTIFVIAVWFSYLNTDDITINLGILCSFFYVIKILNQKRIIKSDLDQKIEELNAHRASPLKDAN